MKKTLRRTIKITLLFCLFTTCQISWALEPTDIPKIYSNIFIQDGLPHVKSKGKILSPSVKSLYPSYSLEMLNGTPQGTNKGFRFTFKDSSNGLTLAKGKLFYSLLGMHQGRFPLPKYRFKTKIVCGHAQIDMDDLKGRFDFTDWEKNSRGFIYYRVSDDKGFILYEGKFAFMGEGPFKVDTSIIEGPFVCKVTDNSAVIALTLNKKAPAKVIVDKRVFDSPNPAYKHEILVDMLNPATEYTYRVLVGQNQETYSLATAPKPGAQSPFTFCFGSDSRNSIPSGERDFMGVNAYILRKAMVLTAFKNTAFMQFTGDTMSGYDGHPMDQKVKFAAFKRAILPWCSRMPIYVGIGNHESLAWIWDDGSKYGLSCDGFPYDQRSSEGLFAQEFVMPENGPLSEDNAWYDPQPDKDNDFPTYKENVYFYTWGNVAMVVLNSQYLFAPSLPYDTTVGGNIWGYMMDNQLAWLKKTLFELENNPKIDHVFVTQHTPMFPNGGHVQSTHSMWWNGKNKYKPVINIQGIKTDKSFEGCLERRDQFLKALLEHSKVRALLCGDEHNYSRVLVDKGMPIYDAQKYTPETPLKITRPFWHIVIGSVGAPYYAKVDAPWNKGYPKNTKYLKAFSPSHALAFFHVKGKKISLEVLDSETLETIDMVDDFVSLPE